MFIYTQRYKPLVPMAFRQRLKLNKPMNSWNNKSRNARYQAMMHVFHVPCLQAAQSTTSNRKQRATNNRQYKH